MRFSKKGFFASVGLFCCTIPILAQGPDIKEIMGKLNKAGGLYPAIQKGLKAPSPNWAGLKNDADEFTDLAASLGKNKPPKGDAASWQKMTKEYADEASKLKAAVESKNKANADAAIAKLGASCSACHKAHKN